MTFHSRKTLLLSTLLVLVLAACSSGFNLEVTAIDDTTVVRSLKYYENGGQDQGPLYTVTMNVPEEWVGEFETRLVGNRLSFEYIVGPNESVPIVQVEALSEVQYWEQIGSYPGDYTNIANKIDTYFVYTLPINASTNSVSADTLAELNAQVPAVMESFAAESSASPMMYTGS